ncbi:sigma-70 family RNA polymerase sigma factor [Nonomuraea sp. NPDC049486]|uniref:RNA polymerase sigma factor n=1 Tax=Nonomuraea sp. NPDC049486 TaxID=3155773 RepID=UPI00343EBE29
MQRRSGLTGQKGMTELRTADPPDLEQVYRDQRTTLLRLAFLLTGSREQAEDLVQTAFVTACARWDRIQQPLAYLKRAVVNRANSTHRRWARERGRHVVERTTEMPDIDETWTLVKQLSGRQRIVVVLHCYEDLPLVEIAGILSRPAATIRSDLKRALARLRKAMK